MKTAVITGGAGGLGRALAQGLVARGWSVALLDLPGPALDAATGPQITTHPCDLTDPGAVTAACAAIRAAHPSVDLVIHNAGITHIGLFAETALPTHRRVFEVNYFATLNVTAELLDDVRRAGGRHLAISSVAGFAPLYRRSAYSASKHALEGFFRTLREEERAHGVSVSIAMPSFVATNIGRAERGSDGLARPGSAPDGIDYMTPEAAAAAILTGIARGRETIPVGRIARIAAILNRLAPRLYARLMMRQIHRETR